MTIASRETGRRPVAALALLVAAVAACADPTAEPRVVVQRWAELPGVGSDELPAQAPLRLGTATRSAFAVPPVSQLEVEIPEPAEILVFSTAARSAVRSDGRIRFGVQAKISGEWQTIFSDAAAATSGPWRDHRLDLTQRAPGAREFRFQTRAEPAPQAVVGVEGWWGSIAWLGPARERRPNVVLISLDTLGAAQLSSFDNVPGVSPNIDAFLAEGFSFRRALAQYGNTLVSHVSLFTGLYPVHHRYYPGGPLMPVDSLVAELSNRGWLSVGFTEGAFVSAAYGFGTGFDGYDDGALGITRQMAGGAPDTFARAAEWLAEFGVDTRFFLFLHTYEVHTPYAPRDESGWAVVKQITPNNSRRFPAEFQSRRAFAHNSAEVPLSERELAHLQALQSGEIHGLDRFLGSFLSRLGELGLDRNTLVVLTADHGDQFGEHGKVGHGESLHNRVLHVPLGFRWPGRVIQGVGETPVQLVDLMPTVLELAGVALPQGLDGRSLAAQLEGREAPEPRAAFSEQMTARGECKRLGLDKNCRLYRYAVQTGRFKLITSQVPSFSRLYDLDADPLEQHDVASQHPDETARLQALLAVYLAGAAPAPDTSAETVPDAMTRERLEALGYLE